MENGRLVMRSPVHTMFLGMFEPILLLWIPEIRTIALIFPLSVAFESTVILVTTWSMMLQRWFMPFE